jgi:hypothetical protein
MIDLFCFICLVNAPTVCMLLYFFAELAVEDNQ